MRLKRSTPLSTYTTSTLQNFSRDFAEVELTESQAAKICGVRAPLKVRDMNTGELLRYVLAMSLVNNERLLEQNRDLRLNRAQRRSVSR
jgi:hypothetical protein